MEIRLADRVEIRLQDYREIDDGPYDAISSIGMAEHVGNAALPGYAVKMMSLLRPKGRLLNHAIASVRPLAEHGRQLPFIQRYIFPDGEILPLSRTINVLERAGFEIRDCEALREHYALTLRAWVQALRGSFDDAVRLVGEQRARTWLLYLASCALTFEANGQLTIHQVLTVHQATDGASGLPPLVPSGSARRRAQPRSWSVTSSRCLCRRLAWAMPLTYHANLANHTRASAAPDRSCPTRG